METLGNRMKNNYENRYRFKLTRRMPVIIRLDGKAFHTLTRKCDKPFDEKFQLCMVDTAISLCSNIQGVKLAYTQSDEISLLITDFDTLKTDAWFDYNIQKMCSVSAGIASTSFSSSWYSHGIFDSRVFNIPKEEVCNYFIWRQKDWQRNSIQMLSQSYFSHKQLHKKKTSDMHEMLHDIGINWANLDYKWKNGVSMYKVETTWITDSKVIFTEDRNITEQYLETIE